MLHNNSLVGFKDRQEMSRFQVLPWSQFLQTLVLIFPWKSTHAKLDAKMANFLLVFSEKKIKQNKKNG